MIGEAEVMARFDDWVTDPRATRRALEGFVVDPALIGRSALGAYTVAMTSGTTGTRGIFLIERPAACRVQGDERAHARQLSWTH